MRLLLATLLLISFGCQKKNNTAEEALHNFIDLHVGKTIKREKLATLITGKLLEQLEALPPEEFEELVDMRNIKKGSVKIVTRTCSDVKCTLTYTISYSTMSDNKKVYDTEVRKIAEIERVGDEWLISDVSNIKTYHDSLEAINPLE